VIDLSRMKGVRVDPARRTARVEGGCTWGDVDHATHAFGLATPSGLFSTTGVGGLTLGGGLGYLTRKFGLSIDNLIGADMVLADGRFVTVSADEDSDLFWAIRGGGGNFGVVTSFLFRLHPVKTVVAGPTLWPLNQAANLMRWYREFITSAPEDMNGIFAFLTAPPVPPFPEHLHLQSNVRGNLVLHGARGRLRRCVQADPRLWFADTLRNSNDGLPGTAERVRQPLSTGSAVVLEG
jgi:FAD/FMN-containing dehydrogenase